jgi:hypothetical protein
MASRDSVRGRRRQGCSHDGGGRSRPPVGVQHPAKHLRWRSRGPSRHRSVASLEVAISAAVQRASPAPRHPALLSERRRLDSLPLRLLRLWMILHHLAHRLSRQLQGSPMRLDRRSEFLSWVSSPGMVESGDGTGVCDNRQLSHGLSRMRSK